MIITSWSPKEEYKMYFYCCKKVLFWQVLLQKVELLSMGLSLWIMTSLEEVMRD